MNANGLRKKLMKGLVIDKWDLVKIIESQEKRIAELEKDSKPAYWVLKTGHGTKFEEVKPYCEIDYWQPLYTTPQAKPRLSDEEINNIADKCFGTVEYELWQQIIKFARAIENRRMK